jgi:hypothetical protein
MQPNQNLACKSDDSMKKELFKNKKQHKSFKVFFYANEGGTNKNCWGSC